MVDYLETDNQQQIPVLLEEENRRRAQMKPEHNASNDASQPLCDIPRCLIELTPKQWSDRDQNHRGSQAKLKARNNYTS